MGQVILSDNLERFLEHFPQLDRFVVGRKEVMGCVLSPAPLDLVDFFFNLQRLEIVKLRLMRLELGVELVFARLLLCLASDVLGGDSV